MLLCTSSLRQFCDGQPYHPTEQHNIILLLHSLARLASPRIICWYCTMRCGNTVEMAHAYRGVPSAPTCGSLYLGEVCQGASGPLSQHHINTLLIVIIPGRAGQATVPKGHSRTIPLYYGLHITPSSTCCIGPIHTWTGREAQWESCFSTFPVHLSTPLSVM